MTLDATFSGISNSKMPGFKHFEVAVKLSEVLLSHAPSPRDLASVATSVNDIECCAIFSGATSNFPRLRFGAVFIASLPEVDQWLLQLDPLVAVGH